MTPEVFVFAQYGAWRRMMGLGDSCEKQKKDEHEAEGHPVRKCNVSAERRFADFRAGLRNRFADLGAALPLVNRD